MEDLVNKNDAFVKIRKGLGIFMILIAILRIFIFIDSRKIFDLLQFMCWAIIAAYHLTNGFGLEKSFIQIGDNSLKIKWMNKIRPFMVSDSETENICFKKTEIIINRINKKPLRLKRSYLELKHKFF